MTLTNKTFADLITFTRASTATRVNSLGLIESVATNGPRFDHDPATLAPKGLLIEEARTNRFLQSEDFTTTWAAAAVGTSTRVLSAALFAGINGGLITATSANGGLRQVSSGLTSTQVYTASFFLSSDSDSVMFLLENGAGAYGTSSNVTLTPATGAIGTLTGFTSARSTAVPGGYLYEIVLPPAGGGLTANMEWRLASGDAMKIAIPQFEAGAFATSYIPTVASTVTRALDAASITGANFSDWFNAAEGTVYVEASYAVASNLGDRFTTQIDDGTASNRILTVVDIAAVDVGGVRQALIDGGAPVVGLPNKFAFAYKANDFAGSLNGGAVVTDTGGTVPTVNRMTIGSRGADSFFNGHIKDIRFYPTRLTNAELQALTA